MLFKFLISTHRKLSRVNLKSERVKSLGLRTIFLQDFNADLCEIVNILCLQPPLSCSRAIIYSTNALLLSILGIFLHIFNRKLTIEFFVETTLDNFALLFYYLNAEMTLRSSSNTVNPH
jgi:hypothetical protein